MPGSAEDRCNARCVVNDATRPARVVARVTARVGSFAASHQSYQPHRYTTEARRSPCRVKRLATCGHRPQIIRASQPGASFSLGTPTPLEEHLFRRIVAWLLRPLLTLVLRLTPDDDAWERLTVTPRLNVYGGGLRLDFPKFLSGPSAVSVSSLDDIQQWLLGCKYEADEILFSEPDFWQHPTTFERLRAGDCEDFALWAWRKLVELGFDADIVAGYCVKDGKLAGRHAWVVFRQDGKEFLFEPAARTKEAMIRPLSEVRDNYVPEVGADRTGHRFAFTGYLVAQKRQLRDRTSLRTA